MNQRVKAQFRASTGTLQEFGATPQEALAALMQHFSGDASPSIMILPYNRGDAYFTDAQQARLQELKSRQATLTEEERAEQEDLIASAFDATVARALALFTDQIVNPLYTDVAKQAGERCEYCHAPESIFNFAFDVEHIQPRSTGGGDDTGNLALACESCNSYKSDATVGWDEESQETVRLFHARQDQWTEHFQFDSKTGQIEGITAIGRATIARLKMNSHFQTRARWLWAQLGLYP